MITDRISNAIEDLADEIVADIVSNLDKPIPDGCDEVVERLDEYDLETEIFDSIYLKIRALRRQLSYANS